MAGSLLVWGVAIIGIVVMKKIEPHNKVFPPYVILIAILVTILTYPS